MTTKSTKSTSERIDELAARIRKAETEAKSATETERAELARLRAEQEQAEQAETERRAARARVWAEHYLSHGLPAELAEQSKAARAARARAREVLAETPWVQAVLDWQAALDEHPRIVARERRAREILGRGEPKRAATRAEVMAMREGVIGLGQLGEVLYRLLTEPSQGRSMADVDELIAHPGGDGDPLEELAVVVVDERDPLARLSAAGGAVESTQHTRPDGSVITVHRNLETGDWVQTDRAGTVITTKARAEAEAKQAKQTAGSMFGSELDPAARVYRKVRVS